MRDRLPPRSRSGSGAAGDDSRDRVVDRSQMTDSVREHAFDQFFRADEARRAAPDGSGIGLYAARGLIEAMGGSISLEGGNTDGTVVSIRLPAEPIPAGES
jgi:signal transduction histidine kinase